MVTFESPGILCTVMATISSIILFQLLFLSACLTAALLLLLLEKSSGEPRPLALFRMLLVTLPVDW